MGQNLDGREKNPLVAWELRDGVAVLSVSNPPVNALVQPVRDGLFRAIERAESDPAVAAVVIQAEGRTFPAGADVREYSLKTAEPTLAELCDRIEACQKPVIAAIHGTALGGGFELALACHYRLALGDARFGFPEITLGLVPNAGGTQRLPRLVGARAALDVLVSGKPIDALQAHAMGLIDKIVGKNLQKAAFGSARKMAEAQTRPRPTRSVDTGLSDPAQYLERITARRKVVTGDRRAAVGRVIDLVEAALLVPFDAGLMMERVAYEDLVQSDEARGLRHAFLAERRAGRGAALVGVASRSIASIGIVGAGPLARDIAVAALATGVPVRLALEDDSAITHARGRIEAALARAVETGRITGRDRDTGLERLVVSENYSALADCDVVIEALAESPVRKAAALTRVSQVVLSGCVIASSTAECDVPTLAGAVSRADRFAVCHFIAPADRIRLVEIAPAPGTAPQTLATLAVLARSMGKVPIVTAARIGLVFNHMVRAYYTAAALLLEQGAMPGEVDGAMRAFGMPLGPFQAQDIAGLDSVWGLAAEDCASRLPLLMIENAWYGQRTGQGFYRYEEGERGGRAAPDVLNLIRKLRDRQGVEPQDFSAETIQQRCVYAMANAGAELVDLGVVSRVSDIDAAILLALGFPRERGGPMHVADGDGALAVRKLLGAWAAENEFWRPAPLFTELVKNGQTFEARDTL